MFEDELKYIPWALTLSVSIRMHVNTHLPHPTEYVPPVISPRDNIQELCQKSTSVRSFSDVAWAFSWFVSVWLHGALTSVNPGLYALKLKPF